MYRCVSETSTVISTISDSWTDRSPQKQTNKTFWSRKAVRPTVIKKKKKRNSNNKTTLPRQSFASSLSGEFRGEHVKGAKVRQDILRASLVRKVIGRLSRLWHYKIALICKTGNMNEDSDFRVLKCNVFSSFMSLFSKIFWCK